MRSDSDLHVSCHGPRIRRAWRLHDQREPLRDPFLQQTEEVAMNPIQMLKQDHRTVQHLFRRFDAADRLAERQKLGQEIIEELSVHSVIEEQLIYPLLRERSGMMEDAVLNALEEHHAVKLLLAELDK